MTTKFFCDNPDCGKEMVLPMPSQMGMANEHMIGGTMLREIPQTADELSYRVTILIERGPTNPAAWTYPIVAAPAPAVNAEVAMNAGPITPHRPDLCRDCVMDKVTEALDLLKK